jgi:pimeloyl-ACP methyl ester carboxylesterase
MRHRVPPPPPATTFGARTQPHCTHAHAGWPGSIVEFEALVQQPELAGYSLVLPSLPGYGFSSSPSVPGVDVVAVAQVRTLAAHGIGAPCAPLSRTFMSSGGDPFTAAPPPQPHSRCLPRVHPPGLTLLRESARVCVLYRRQVMAALMETLGYSRYYVQGGDWGGLVAAALAQV